MVRLLIVDDEVYAVQAVEQGIDWASLGISEVLCAYDAEEAKELLQQHSIDLMICDIEMPGSNGVELLEWTNEHAPSTVTIMLTAHADFNYAQQVLHLGGFDYLLKPIRYDQLKKVVERAIAEVEGQKEAKRFEDMVKENAELQAAQKPLLKELFWQDLLSKRIQPDPAHWSKIMSTYQLSFGLSQYVLPILISVEHWDQEFTERDEEVLLYALRNSASELLFPGGAKGEVIADRGGILFAMLHADGPSSLSLDALKEACSVYIRACFRYFYCKLSCYIGEAVQLPEVGLVYHRLIELEQANVTNNGQVVALKEQEGAEELAGRKALSLNLDTAEWMHHLEAGKPEAIIRQIEDIFKRDALTGIHSESLDSLYHTLLGFVYQAVHHKGGSVKRIIGSPKWAEAGVATRSVPQFLTWARKLVHSTTEYFDNNRSESSALVEKVKSYVETHLQSVSREEVASAVYLNSAYLSRLYKRETGTSLMDYIISVKMNRAKHRLTQSNVKIGEISLELGYDNLPHFAKMFKKQVGVTPQEYRKRYKMLG